MLFRTGYLAQNNILLDHSLDICTVTGIKKLAYAIKEERWNTATHAVGAVLSLLGLVILLLKAFKTATIWDDFSFTVYGLSLIILYTVSSLYHAARSEKTRRIMRILDHSAIFLLIAGTYTPVTLLAVKDAAGGYVFAAVWSLAFIGIILKLTLTGKYNFLSTVVYLAMGWLAIVIYNPLVESLPFGALVLIFGGGLLYSAGTIFYLWEKLPFNHAIWHVMVILGSFCHFIAIYHFI